MPKLIDAASAAEVISKRFGISLCELVDTFPEIPCVDMDDFIHKGKLYDAIWDARQEKQIKSVTDVLAFIDSYSDEVPHEGRRE